MESCGKPSAIVTIPLPIWSFDIIPYTGPSFNLSTSKFWRWWLHWVYHSTGFPTKCLRTEEVLLLCRLYIYILFNIKLWVYYSCRPTIKYINYSFQATHPVPSKWLFPRLHPPALLRRPIGTACGAAHAAHAGGLWWNRQGVTCDRWNPPRPQLSWFISRLSGD